VRWRICQETGETLFDPKMLQYIQFFIAGVTSCDSIMEIFVYNDA